LTFSRLLRVLLPIFAAGATEVLGQGFDQQMRFTKHLFQLKEYREAASYLSGIGNSYQDTTKLDSIQYYIGTAHYHLKDIQSSLEAYQRITFQSPFFDQSRLLIGFQLAYSGQYAKSAESLVNYSPGDSLMIDTRAVELAGLYLLSRDYPNYEAVSKGFNGRYFQLKSSEDAFSGYYESLKAFNPKSPFLAGTLSAILPGAGKIYAGKTGQGIGNMLLTGLFALQTWESYKKDGLKSARFIIFGSLLGVSYVSNIYGSVFSVKIRKDEFNEEINNAILIDMHVPLRTLLH